MALYYTPNVTLGKLEHLLRKSSFGKNSSHVCLIPTQTLEQIALFSIHRIVVHFKNVVNLVLLSSLQGTVSMFMSEVISHWGYKCYSWSRFGGKNTYWCIPWNVLSILFFFSRQTAGSVIAITFELSGCHCNSPNMNPQIAKVPLNKELNSQLLRFDR